jgi:GNAT superfamily N-acetyltransferase
MTLSYRIVELAERPDWVPIAAEWIYNQWWTTVAGASVATLSDRLQGHLTLGRIPLTLVASVDSRPVGTATLLEHDAGTEQWPDFSPWLAGVYVVPELRRCGMGSALVKAAESKASELGVQVLYLSTVDRQEFYAGLGWQLIDRDPGKVVMSRRLEAGRFR